MIKTFTLCLALTLPTAAFAQQWGGSGTPSRGSHSAPSHAPAQPAASHPAASTLIDGRQPLWGGSPPAARVHRTVYLPYYVIPEAIEAPEPVAAPVIIDTVYAAPPAASYQMQVVTNHPPRELTTIEVYRLQPRFQKP